MNTFLKYLSNVMTKLIILLLIVLGAFTISSRQSSNGLPKLAGYQFMVVLSDSMSPSINAGDVIMVRHVAVSAIKKGDIITYKDPADLNRYVTHRVVGIHKGKGLEFGTKGDANNAVDNLMVPAKNLIGSLEVRIPKIGHLVKYTNSTKPLIWLVIVPALLALLSEIVQIAKALSDEEKRKQERAEVKPWSTD
ncbi:MAG: signal peptidase I [Clostridia bacterium]|nr:signal peptidase I [Clostridia bacterium]